MAYDFGDEGELTRRFNRRALLLGLGQIAAFGALSGRLYHLQVMDGSRYAPLADDNRLSLKLLAPVRGRILDRGGVILAANEESFRVLVQPAQTGDITGVIGLLSRIVPVPAELQEQLIAKSKRKARGAAIVVASDLTFEQVAEINLLAPQLPGVETEVAYTRKYPLGAPLSHVTGHLGVVDKRAMDDDPALRVPGIKIGKTGLERGMEIELRGVAGARRFEVDARGRTIRYFEETAPQPGVDVVSSIDVRLQTRTMERLSRETRAAAVIMDVTTGEVMVMASVPTFDPNDVTGQVSQSAWRRLAEGEHQPMLNRAISGLYPPGSTLKIATALAGLEAGVTDPNEKIRCNGSFTLAGQSYRCWKRHGHGDTDLHKAVRESCDVYFYETAKRTGIKPLAAMARRLGLGEAKAEGLELEKAGVVPDTDWKRWRFGEGWSTGDTVLTGIGQGYALATPLQLAVMMARVATGKAVVPSFVRPRQDGPAAFASLGLKAETLDAVRRALVASVNEDGGTGAAARPAGGMVIAGKTGTSQVRRASEEDEDDPNIPWELRDHALFVSYFPAEAPRYAIAVVVEHGGGGGTAAAPLVKDLIEYVLEDDPANRPALPGSPGITKSARASPVTRREG